jgi:hypothetical protein
MQSSSTARPASTKRVDRFIAAGGGWAVFEKYIGQVESIERQWYGYLAELQSSTRRATPPVRVVCENGFLSMLIADDGPLPLTGSKMQF